MLYACGSAAGVFARNKIWLAGGQGNSGILNRVQSFSMSENNQWQEETALKTGRKSLALAAVNDAIYAIGGNSDKSKHIASNLVEIFDLVATITDEYHQPNNADLTLVPNYPNPFNTTTIIRVYAPVNTYTKITIYNMLGENVRLLYQGSITGWQQFQFDGRDKLGKMLPSGQYFLYLTTANEKHVQKIILAK